MQKKIIIQQSDLDTCLTALILNIKKTDNLIVRNEEANNEELNNPEIFCIEAGGSGQIENCNFDHHLSNIYFPPACNQALSITKSNTEHLALLVDYVCCIDECKTIEPIAFPSLSSLFSGMRMTEKDEKRRFNAGLAILEAILLNKIDPFKPMPQLPEWEKYISAKIKDNKLKKKLLINIKTFITVEGLKVGQIKVPTGTKNGIGGFRSLYTQGCAIGILFHPTFNSPQVRKFTIGSNCVCVSSLLPQLNQLESGWGGRATIIGSPRTGSNLDFETVAMLVKNNVYQLDK